MVWLGHLVFPQVQKQCRCPLAWGCSKNPLPGSPGVTVAIMTCASALCMGVMHLVTEGKWLLWVSDQLLQSGSHWSAAAWAVPWQMMLGWQGLCDWSLCTYMILYFAHTNHGDTSPRVLNLSSCFLGQQHLTSLQLVSAALSKNTVQCSALVYIQYINHEFRKYLAFKENCI